MELSYDGNASRLRSDLRDAQREAWARLGRAGTWWSGEERLAIAGECRRARSCALCAERRAALSPYGLAGRHQASGPLAAPYVDAVHRLTTDPGRLTERWLESLRAEGLEDERYVELVGVVISTVLVDTFHHAMGFAEPPLPAPEPGEPSRRRPAGARRTVAWVPLVSAAEGLDEVYRGDPTTPFVRQAMSLVPAEVHNLDRIEQAHYLPFPAVRNPATNAGRRLTRPQIELVAARVSYLSGCFY